MRPAEFANGVDTYEAAHSEPPHLNQCCLPSRLCILNMIKNYTLERTSFYNTADINFVLSIFGSLRDRCFSLQC